MDRSSLDRTDDVETLLPLEPHIFMLLLVLEAGPLHGYGLKKAVRDRTDGRIDLDPGGLYRILARLEGRGIVEGVEDDQADERRNYYGLTPFGRRVLEAEARRMAGLVRLPEVAALLGEAGGA